MPTINQLIRKNRKTSKKKSMTPSLAHTFNTLKNKRVIQKKGCPQKRNR